MQPLTIKQRGLERSALVVRGQTTIAEVFTDREPGDQYQTAALIAAAPDLLAALQSLLAMPIKGHALADRLQFSDSGRAILDQARAAIARATGADHA